MLYYMNKNLSNNKLNNIITKYIKLPSDKYVFYDEYLPANLKPSFKKPIGLYDPYGDNINPLTGEPYKNIYSLSKPIKYNSGNAEGSSVLTTYKNWAYIWSNLPLYSIVGKVIKSIRENQVTLIKAGTGTGKSFLAGKMCSQAFNYQKKIIMTLPKKILARDTANTTAQSCDVVIGEEVGYYFKGAYEINKNGKETKIIFTTTGSLIRKLTGDDPYLSEYSCIIIDEAHERSIETDELILFLKKALKKRDDLKIVFISATVDVDIFKKYYEDYSFNIVDMGNDTPFAIKDYYEEKKPDDWQKLAVEKVMKILKESTNGDILVFVKSGSDGNKIRQYLEPKIKELKTNENPFMTILEGKSSKQDQEYATKEFNYRNHPDADISRPYTRKIVFSTNVAESSLTVKGAVYVIDCGLALEDLYEPLKNASALLEKFISQSAVKQRRGRVGRTKPGVCYHLYSEAELKTFPEYPIPSIKKSDLTMSILDIMKIEYIKNLKDVNNLLNEMMTPPTKDFVDSAIKNLYSMGAISSMDDTAILTDIGRAMTNFSGLPLPFARAIIASYYYRCKYDVIPIFVIIGLIQGRIDNLYLDYKPKTKVSNAEYKKEATEYKKKQHKFDDKHGDFLTIYNVYQAFRDFMKLPKIFIQNAGGSNNNYINTNSNSIISTSSLTKKTFQDAKKWCIDNGISSRIFINMRDTSHWDKVGDEVRKIDRILMDIVQPAHLRHSNYKDYKKDNGKATLNELKKENIIAINENRTISPENKINLIGGFDDDITNNENVSINIINKVGFTNKKYEVNYFPNVKLFKSKEENILMAISHGLFINIATKMPNNKYVACYPIEKSYCQVDMNSTLSLKVKPSIMLYYELFMLREGQKVLKLNCITKLPMTVSTEMKHLYESYISDCYKKIDMKNINKQNDKKQYGKKQYGKKYDKKQYGKKHGKQHGKK